MAPGWTISTGHALPPWSLGGHSLGGHTQICIYIHTGWVDKDKCATLGEPTHCKLHSAATVCHALLNTFDDADNGDWSHKKRIGLRTNVLENIFLKYRQHISIRF